MPREKKPKLKKRPDGRYACRYHGQWFYSYDHDECLRLREEFKQAEREGRLAVYFVSEYAENWLARTYPDANRATYEGVKRHVQLLKNGIGNLPVNNVKPSDIKEVYSTYYNGLANSYILAAKRVFCAIFDAAVADGIIHANPARDRTAKPHKGKSGGHRSITPQEREWMLTYCKNHRAFPAAMAMLYAGIRPQEAKAMNIDRDIDLDRETVTVRQTAHIDPNNRQKYAHTDTGKTERANRQIPLLPPLKDAIKGKHGLLMTDTKGQPVSRTVANTIWVSYRRQMEKAINGIDRNWYGRTKEHKAILAAGGKLPPWQTFDVTPYDLRHSFATMCRDMTPPIELHTVIKWMGHSDATMILKIYDEVTSERDESEAKRLRESLTTNLTTKP